jgi:excisionase family DNA binding protein
MSSIDPGVTTRKAEPETGAENDQPPLLVTVPEAARLLAVSRATVWKFIKDGKLETVSIIEWRRHITYASLRNLIEGRNEKAKGVASAPGLSKHQGNVHEHATSTPDGGKLQTP